MTDKNLLVVEMANATAIGEVSDRLRICEAALDVVDSHANFANWIAASRAMLHVVLKWRSHMPSEVYDAADTLQQSLPTFVLESSFNDRERPALMR